MKLCLILLFPMMMGIIVAASDFKPSPELDERWEQFKNRFNKKYATEAETIKRREIWEKNVAHIDKHNKEYDEGKHSYKLAENKFTDMTKDEWKNHLGKKPPKKEEPDDEELDG